MIELQYYDLDEKLECYPDGIELITINEDEIVLNNGMKKMKSLVIEEISQEVLRYLFAQMLSMGLEEGMTIEAFQKRAGIDDAEKGWVEEAAELLSRFGVLSYENSVISYTNEVRIENVFAEWETRKKKWDEQQGIKQLVESLEKLLVKLPFILRGQEKISDIISYDNQKNYISMALDMPAGDNAALSVVKEYLNKRIEADKLCEIKMAYLGIDCINVLEENGGYFCAIKEATNMEKTLETEYNHNYYDILLIQKAFLHEEDFTGIIRKLKVLLRKNGIIVISAVNSYSILYHMLQGLLDKKSMGKLNGEVITELLQQEGFFQEITIIQNEMLLQNIVAAAVSDGIVRVTASPQNQYTEVQEVNGLDSIIEVQKVYSEKTQEVQVMPKTENHKPEQQMVKENNLKTESSDNTQNINEYITNAIVEKLAETLQVNPDAIEYNDAFSNYGIDSISGVHLIQDLNEFLQIELDTTDVFNYSSVNELRDYIVSQYSKIISKNLHQEVSQLTSQKVEEVKQEESPNLLKSKMLIRNLDKTQESALNAQPINVSMESELETNETPDIAVIGMSGRFAKSNNIDELWKHLNAGDDLVEDVTRWNLSDYYKDKTEFCNKGSFINNMDEFDAAFFNISKLEATYMDPQQRVFLEECWNALENAGYVGDSIHGKKCGVYIGTVAGDYQSLIEEDPPAQSYWGNQSSVLPARISYYLNLHGPAIAIDTACSSSLVAIHLACQSLLQEDLDMALAGGVFLQSTPGFYTLSEKAGMLSKTGHCYTFDEKANGFVPGEGAGVLILKKLEKAQKDGDFIYAVIKGSNINQDGATNGITAPSGIAQEELETSVYEKFNINPEDIQLVEAHGTGTKLGDPIEFNALVKAFRKYTNKEKYCALGSIKANIGHTAAAAGVASIIKVVLSMMHKKITPEIHYDVCNTNMKLENSPFYITSSSRNWEVEEGRKRCAAISSFGFSGTNAHVVIEELPYTERTVINRPGYLIVLSAQTSEQLHTQISNLYDACQKNSTLLCQDISYTLLLGRKHFSHRFACIVKDTKELVQVLQNWLSKVDTKNAFVGLFNDKKFIEDVLQKNRGNDLLSQCNTITQESIYYELLKEIADLYIQGYALNFELLFSKEEGKRVGLPTYPFHRECFWVDSRSDYYVALQESKKKQLPSKENENNIAIIGMSGKFPNAESIDEMWNLILNGKDAVPKSFGEHFNQFDSVFFGLSSDEARSMDPRQMLLLEETWKALEDAGYGERQLENSRIGVFVGTEDADFQTQDKLDHRYLYNNSAVLASKISYYLQLKGPNITVNTDSSSGMAALYQACLSLEHGQCSTAIVAGINLFNSTKTVELLTKNRMISSNKKYLIYDKNADGIVPGEAIVVVVLKKVDNAVKDKDSIYAIIKGCSMNYDGKGAEGALPDAEMQADLLKDLYKQKNINISDIGYLITDGTGIPARDRQELKAMSEVFYTENNIKTCVTAGGKESFGHTFAASGLLSLVNVVKALNSEIIPANVNYIKESTYSDLDNTKLYFNTQNQPWKISSRHRLGCINSFGLGGTNVHTIIADYEQYESKKSDDLLSHYIIVFSAKTQESLLKQMENMLCVLEDKSYSLADISYTMIDGRKYFQYRRAVIVKNTEHAVQTIMKLLKYEECEEAFSNIVSLNHKRQKMIQNYIDDITKKVYSQKNKENEELLYVLGELYCQGYGLSARDLFEGINVRKIHLPIYSFEKNSYKLINNSDAEVIVQSNNEIVSKPRKTKLIDTNDITITSVLDKGSVSKYSNIIQLSSKEESAKQYKEEEVVVKEKEFINETISVTGNIENIEQQYMDKLVSILADVLVITPVQVDVDEKFIDMGLDSIIAVEWVGMVNKEFGSDIDASAIYKYSSIHGLAKHIMEKASLSDEVILPIEETEKVEQDEKIEQDGKIQQDDKERMKIEKNQLVNKLKSMLCEILVISPDGMDIDDNFIDMGLDSIIGVEWINWINKEYNTNVKVSDIYSYPSINILADNIIHEVSINSEEYTLENIDDIIGNVISGTLSIDDGLEQLDKI
ncbi:beta-ketoacyl synthase N-terminal-like domain-containing protein [Anaeromicropila populeti]|uniref:Ketoacyl-synthetase C-terminal extension n=1 Tax=Anaeromicropila populeti TaxID=37658 RepID=A0A1I6IZW5_9FIRM|nr:beta-ketoacyl synthase N-terminal-like domain-containing protein [Anaeromicropila populeti]SFR72239.1 Ketoacyl-synthetase C-terminal extension [Anaeromicropila populeti]